MIYVKIKPLLLEYKKLTKPYYFFNPAKPPNLKQLLAKRLYLKDRLGNRFNIVRFSHGVKVNKRDACSD